MDTHHPTPTILSLTELRSKGSLVEKILQEGKYIILVKRSKQIGVIYPPGKLQAHKNKKVTVPTMKLSVKDDRLNRKYLYPPYV